MECQRYYYEFGFPLANIPRPGLALSEPELSDTVVPLLEGTSVLLSALIEAFHVNAIDTKQGGAAIALLEGHLETALHLLRRFLDRETTGTTTGEHEAL